MSSNMVPNSFVALALAALVAGCAGANAIEDGVPQAALADGPELARFPAPVEPGSTTQTESNATDTNQPLSDASGAPVGADAPAVVFSDGEASVPDVSAPPRTALSTGGPRNTGTFPNLNDEPMPSLDMISDDEKAALEAQMQALKADHKSGRISARAYRKRLLYLKNLARSHSRDTIERIEGE